MIYIIMGIFAFVLFFLYDINSILLKNKLLYCCFFAGFILLSAATAGIIITSWASIRIDFIRLGIYGGFAFVFFGLLIYTLFFALPFQDTYLDTQAPPKVCRNGVYALCRHPGVLWFAGFYIFLGLALGIPLLKTAAVLFSLLNLLYVFFQDRWTFMKNFNDYGEYKTAAPFLIPNIHSIMNCFKII
ncbi:MAG TPA: hypothetical protein VN258_06175 [Mobilitalea sp.]|nr:hypothetical protein [Mobilitalea sp.]